MIEFRLLGPLEAVEDGRALPLGGHQQRVVLALLLLHANELVLAERLVDAVWGERPPPTAATTVQVYVSRLRKLLGRELLLTRAPGYLLRVAPEQIDVRRAERLIAAANETQDPARRSALYRDALALWRGEVLAEFAYEELVSAEAARLEELRLATLESAIDAELELGRHAVLVPELEALLEEQPLRERMRRGLMLALYGAGRQTDALAVYRNARHLLLEELGLEPGPALKQLERQILSHDPALDSGSPPRRPARGREERKMLSALVVELVGLDDASLDPEAARSLLDPHLARLGEELVRFGGNVEKLIGDAVLAVFGAPVASEDHAERAVRAGLAVRDLIAETGMGNRGLRLCVRVGVGTGEALVPAGQTPDWSSSASGAVFGTADRLRTAAPANAVLVSEPTYRATRGVVSYRALEGLAAWEALAASAAIRARPRAGEVALVGRQDELGLVAERIRSAAEMAAPQLVTVVGTPGIGKTRLLGELAARPEAAGVLWLQGRSIPYGDGAAYWAFAEAVKTHAGILDTDAPVEAAEKLRRALPGAADEAVENQLRLLLGLHAGETATARAAAFAGWRGFLEALAGEGPVVLALEDVHWADDGLLDFVEHVASSSDDAPMVILCTARPELLERRPQWAAAVPRATVVELAPLSDAEMRALVGALLADQSLAAQLTDPVVARVDGNPLFAEEYVRSLLEGELLEEQLPESVHNVIAARLDGLPPDAKALLQDAAVIGKVFWPGSVAAIGGQSRAGCEAQLEQLIDGDFVRRDPRSTMQDETQYTFRHVLIRDVAYGQMPRGERSRKHRRAAEWIETHARADDVAELMAHHYLNAIELARAAGLNSDDLLPRTVERLHRAGERARQLYANEDAAAYFKRALALLAEAPGDAEWRDELSSALEESLGDVLELTGSHANGESAFGAALRYVSDRDRIRTARLLRKEALSRQLQHRIDDARETFAAADDALGDEPLGSSWWHERCEIAIQRLQLLYFGGPLETFAQEVERVRPMVEARGTATQRRFLYSHIGMVALRRDRYVAGDKTLQHHRAALAAAREAGGVTEIAHMHFAYGFCLLWARQLDQAEAEITQGLALAERIGDATTCVRCLNYLSVIERWRGNVEAARELANRTLEAARRAEMLEYVFQARAMLAWVAWRDGDRDLAEVEASAVSTGWDDFLGQRVFAWMPHWPLLAVALARGDEAGAAEHARTIVEPTRQPMPPDLESMLASAVIASDRGEREAARESLAAEQLAGAYGYL